MYGILAISLSQYNKIFLVINDIKYSIIHFKEQALCAKLISSVANIFVNSRAKAEICPNMMMNR